MSESDKSEAARLSEWASAWPKEQLWQRLNRCRAMLVIHDLLTDDESDRAKTRLEKMLGVDTGNHPTTG